MPWGIWLVVVLVLVVLVLSVLVLVLVLALVLVLVLALALLLVDMLVLPRLCALRSIKASSLRTRRVLQH
jgi:hypothetical protein